VLRSIQSYVAAGTGYIERYDAHVCEDTSSPLVDHVLTLLALWPCQLRHPFLWKAQRREAISFGWVATSHLGIQLDVIQLHWFRLCCYGEDRYYQRCLPYRL